MGDPVVLSTLAENTIVWFVAELIAVVIIVFLILRWRPGFLGKRTIGQSFNSALDRRAAQIDEQLSAAQRSREEAARIRQESEKDIARARDEAQSIVARASTTSESILHELQDRAQDEYNRIVGQAKAQIEYERQQAELALRRRAADIVVDAAEQVVRQNLDQETDRHIIDASLSDLAELR